MTSADYGRFLPSHYPRVPAVSTWWDWRGRRVHVLRAADHEAPVRVLGIHGGGAHAAALWPFAALAGGDALDVAFPDLPLYGDTVEPRPALVRYDTWIELLCDLVVAEREADDRPLVLFGASMGGMLAYEVAARTRRADAVVVTCLLDPSDRDALGAGMRFPWMGAMAPGALRMLDRFAGGVRVPARWVEDLGKMSSRPELSRLCARDPKGGGVRLPIGFLASFVGFEHSPPEEFDAAPVTLVHPAEDRWTPPENSIRFLDRIKGRTTCVMLEGCGHFPVEEPGLTQLADTMRAIRHELNIG